LFEPVPTLVPNPEYYNIRQAVNGSDDDDDDDVEFE
jgi:hypothetical protein